MITRSSRWRRRCRVSVGLAGAARRPAARGSAGCWSRTGVCFGGLLAGAAGRQHRPRRGWSPTSSRRAAGSSCSCGWCSSPTCCPTAHRCRRAGAAGCGSAWRASLLFLVGAAGDRETFRRRRTTAPTPPLPWLPAPVSDVLGVVGLVLAVLLFFGAVFAVRARLQQSSGDGPAAAAVARLGRASAVPCGARARLGRRTSLLDDQRVVADRRADLAGASRSRSRSAIAILRHRLFDIQLVLSRTLTYGGAGRRGGRAAMPLLLFGADRLLGRQHGWRAARRRGSSRSPCIPRTRGCDVRIERWVYGYRSRTRAAALRLLGATAPRPPTRCTVGETITAAVADALKVERVWVETGDVAAEDDPRGPGAPGAPRRATSATSPSRSRQADGCRPPTSRSLHDLARYAAVTGARRAAARERAAGSRSRIVAAARRSAAACAATCTTASARRWPRSCSSSTRPSPAADGGERDALLAEIARRDAGRRSPRYGGLVDDLRPPAIDEVGLLGAIRQRAAVALWPTLDYRGHRTRRRCPRCRPRSRSRRSGSPPRP